MMLHMVTKTSTAACLAMSCMQGTALAYADDLPDLVINSVDLEATGKCDRFKPVIAGDLVIANAGDARAPLVITGPLFEARDVEDPSFKDVDIRPAEFLAPGETVSEF